MSENYEEIRRLGKGAQGVVHLVKDLRTGDKVVVKKVECNDEQDSVIALKEVRLIQSLQHPNICKYKESFTTWDKKQECQLVNLVMKYYENGDLSGAIARQRKLKKPFSEAKIKNVFGQMCSAIYYLHSKNVIHRDMKPSNVFICDGDHLVLGDFGVSTVMEGQAVKTCTGTLDYLAPEVLNRPYDDRSDIWSIACILLELATAGFMEKRQNSELLFDIKQCPQRLEEILAYVRKEYKYSASMCACLRMALRLNFEQRPTIEELVVLPWVKSCMAQGDVKEESAREGPPLPNTRDASKVLEAIREHHANAMFQVRALELLADLIKKAPEGSNHPVEATADAVKAMQLDPENAPLQKNACRVIKSLIPSASEDAELYSDRTIAAVLMAMRANSLNIDLHIEAVNLLWALSANDVAAEQIGQKGGMQDVIAALRTMGNSAELVHACCNAMWSLAVNEDNLDIVKEEHGAEDILQGLSKFQGEPSVAEAACSALWSFSIDEDIIERVCEVEGIEKLMATVAMHVNRKNVFQAGLMALSSFSIDGNCAYRIAHVKSGVNMVIEGLIMHGADEEILESACAFFANLCEHEDSEGIVCTALSGRKADIQGMRDRLVTAEAKQKINREILSLLKN